MATNVAHLDGCGVSNAYVLALADYPGPIVEELRFKYPGRFLGWSASADVNQPEATAILARAVKSGASGFGEIKSHVDSREALHWVQFFEGVGCCVADEVIGLGSGPT